MAVIDAGEFEELLRGELAARDQRRLPPDLFRRADLAQADELFVEAVMTGALVTGEAAARFEAIVRRELRLRDNERGHPLGYPQHAAETDERFIVAALAAAGYGPSDASEKTLQAAARARGRYTEGCFASG